MLLLAGCCTKKNCESSFEQEVIQLVDFPVNQIDSVYVKSYTRNSDFAVINDSLLTSAETNSDGKLSVYVSTGVNHNHDYIVVIPSLSKTYRISSISVGKEVCNNCIGSMHSYYEELRSYEINDTLQHANYLYIRH